MAERRRGAAAGWIALGLGVAAAAAVAAERAVVKRDRGREDPFSNEPYGELAGRDIGPIASFDGTKLHAESFGTDGPTVVLSHGFSLNRTLWHHQCKDLSAELRLVAYDHRGHGRSDVPATEDYSLDALARDLDAVVRATGDEPVVVVGHSMGGMAALTYCDLLPERLGSRVAGLILVDTTAADVIHGPVQPFGRRATAAAQGVQEIAMRALAGRARGLDRMRRHGSGIAYLATRVMGFGASPSPAQVDFVERMLAEVPSDVWVRLMPAMMALDVTHVLPAIEIPTMVIVGERDRLTPPGAAQRMARELPHGELVVVPDAGHTPMLESHARVSALIREFALRVT